MMEMWKLYERERDLEVGRRRKYSRNRDSTKKKEDKLMDAELENLSYRF